MRGGWPETTRLRECMVGGWSLKGRVFMTVFFICSHLHSNPALWGSDPKFLTEQSLSWPNPEDRLVYSQA